MDWMESKCLEGKRERPIRYSSELWACFQFGSLRTNPEMPQLLFHYQLHGSRDDSSLVQEAGQNAFQNELFGTPLGSTILAESMWRKYRQNDWSTQT